MENTPTWSLGQVGGVHIRIKKGCVTIDREWSA